MIKIIFKNVEKSELAKEAVMERLGVIIEKFPELEKRKIIVTLSMDNSPVQAGPDLFKVKIQLRRGIYRGLILEKSASNMYAALANVIGRIHERVNRHSEKLRSVERSKQRKRKQIDLTPIEMNDEWMSSPA